MRYADVSICLELCTGVTSTKLASNSGPHLNPSTGTYIHTHTHTHTHKHKHTHTNSRTAYISDTAPSTPSRHGSWRFIEAQTSTRRDARRVSHPEASLSVCARQVARIFASLICRRKRTPWLKRHGVRYTVDPGGDVAVDAVSRWRKGNLFGGAQTWERNGCLMQHTCPTVCGPSSINGTHTKNMIAIETSQVRCHSCGSEAKRGTHRAVRGRQFRNSETDEQHHPIQRIADEPTDAPAENHQPPSSNPPFRIATTIVRTVGRVPGVICDSPVEYTPQNCGGQKAQRTGWNVVGEHG